MYIACQGQIITCKHGYDSGHLQSECHERAIDSPALTRSKPYESSTLCMKTMRILNRLNFSSGGILRNQSWAKHLQYLLQAQLKYENNLTSHQPTSHWHARKS